MHRINCNLRNSLRVFVLVALMPGCSQNPTRNAVVMDTGLPLSDNMRSYDVDRYTLRHHIDVDRKRIDGSATVSVDVLRDLNELELDFDGHYKISRIETEGQALDFRRTSEKLFVSFAETQSAGSEVSVTVHYGGRPVEAANPPWDGGFTWAETPSGKPWIATSFQGEGCDIWWPCKDHPSDEPSGVDLFITVTDELVVASNGVLVEVSDSSNGARTWHWQTNVSTNLYGIALNIAPYVAIKGEYTSTNGTVFPTVFYAVEDHEEEARKLFADEMDLIIEFFERRVGPYPWAQEKLGIAETPHLGMEHQTINAYGNEFKRDDYGFDWLLHHEFAHEWFGNLMSSGNYADLWLHEGAGAYMQVVQTEEVMGDAAAHHRLYRAYLAIDACQPIAPRGEFSNDEMYNDGDGPAVNIYNKGSWVLHSLRYLLGERRFWDSIRMLVYDSKEPWKLRPPIAPRHRSTDEFLKIASDIANEDVAWFFDVYVRSGELPSLTSVQDADDVVLTWTATDALPFNMPVPVRVGNTIQRVEFEDNVARLSNTRLRDILIDPNMRVLRKLPSVPSCNEQRLDEA